MRPKLYLFIGYPGAGKTTIARLIAERTGAKHLWADHERRKLFRRPTHSRQESRELYDRLNDATAYLLEQGRSVIFDTNFNFLADRDHLRAIAEAHHADTVVIWVTTPLAVAKQRAVHQQTVRNGYDETMTEAQFDAIAAKLEAPGKDEKILKIDGSKLDVSDAMRQLGMA